jgi:succinate dehydrogenase/fumarate reductase flavoprotein subunit
MNRNLEHLSCDLLIIGSGGAGLRAAIAAKNYPLDVLVISKASPGKGTCTIVSGGVFAATRQGEEPASHISRTLQAGRGINQKDLVEVLAQEGPRRLNELLEWGFKGGYHRGYLFSESRTPARGENIVKCLEQKARQTGTRFLSGLVVADIKIQPQVAGVLAYSPGTDTWLTIRARALVLATGGAGALFSRHDNPKRILGDGYCLALKTGAVLQDMEFVQFYPLGLAEPGYPQFLIPPRLADFGQLYNNAGEDIHSKYGITERPAGERARDQLSQALFTEIYRNQEDVWLDLRGVSDGDWEADPFSASTFNILGERYGARNHPVRIAPMAHHVMGGVKIDNRGQTSVPGLFAAGEVTGGLHGANRMGGNALTETVVFGARAGDAAGKWVLENTDPIEANGVIEFENFFSRSKENSSKTDSGRILADLQKILWENGGILRNQAGLNRAIDEVEAIGEKADRLSLPEDPNQVQRNLEIRFAAGTAKLILAGAQQRTESRGAHYREDYPDQNDDQWHGHLQVLQSPEMELSWTFDPIQKDPNNYKQER